MEVVDKPVSAEISRLVDLWLKRGKIPRRITLHRVDFQALKGEMDLPPNQHGVIAEPLFWQAGEHQIRVISGSAKSYREGTVHLR